MKIELDGGRISTEMDFHKTLAKALDVEEFYGFNYDALWDLLSGSVERPITLIWKNSHASKENMGSAFDTIIDILKQVRNQDEKSGWKDKFDFILD
ncbi:MAG: barstar family protein [Neisseriaceae bacterium]|nr:barstar family protein [Neisseriaceae bacterium]